jgi:hypothetical protein
VCCVIAGEAADTLRQREICTGRWQSEVLCPHVLWQVQVLPRCWQVSAVLCVVFYLTDLGGRELRDREKEKKKKKKQISQVYLAVPNYSQPVNG